MFDVDILIENLGVERYGVRCRVEGWNGGVVMWLEYLFDCVARVLKVGCG